MISHSFVYGSAMWGWNLNYQSVFDLLNHIDDSVTEDYIIDTAWNYPIDKNPFHLNCALKYLIDWLTQRGSSKIRIFVKIGAVSNLGTPEIDLSFDNLTKQYAWLSSKLGSSLWGVGIHWDNRSNKDEIGETLKFLKGVRQNSLSIGLSGIKYPELYSCLSTEDVVIQVKDNLFSHEAYARYSEFFKNAEYWAYGVNNGGMSQVYTQNSTYSLRHKTENVVLQDRMMEYKKDLSLIVSKDISFFQVSLLFALTNKNFTRLLLAPKNAWQFDNIMETRDIFEQYSDSISQYFSSLNIDVGE